MRRIVVVVFLGVVVIGAALFLNRAVGHWAAGAHQRSVMKSLAVWAEEESHIATWEQATHAVDVMTYVSHYYVPGEGYRSDSQTERALEAQRQKTLQTIGRGLEEYSGEHLGADVGAWEEWRRRSAEGVSTQATTRAK